MFSLKRVIPAIAKACTESSRPLHTTPVSRARVPTRTRARAPPGSRIVRDIDPEACLPPLTLLNSASKSGVMDISPSEAQNLLRQYLKLSLQPAKGWEHLLLADYNTTPKTIHLLAQILNRCPTNAQRSLARRLMHTASLLNYSPATFELIESGIRRGSLGLEEHNLPLKHLGVLAKKGDNPAAMALLGKVMYAIDREKEAFEWFTKATTSAQGADFEGAGEAFVQVGRLLKARGDRKGAEEAFRKAALELDEPNAYFYLSQFQADGSVEEKVYLMKAASSGVYEASHGLGVLEMERLKKEAESDDGSRKRTIEDYAMAREWFEVAAAEGYGMSILNLALIHKAWGNAEDAVRWLVKAEGLPEYEAQARGVRRQWEKGEVFRGVEEE